MSNTVIIETLPQPKKRRKSVNYINNRDFFDALVAYQANFVANNDVKMPKYIRRIYNTDM